MQDKRIDQVRHIACAWLCSKDVERAGERVASVSLTVAREHLKGDTRHLSLACFRKCSHQHL